MGPPAGPFYKCTLNDCNSVMVYAIEKMQTVLKRRDAELYDSTKHSQAIPVWTQKENSTYILPCALCTTITPRAFGLEINFKQLLKAEKTSLRKLYGASLECTSMVQITGKYWWRTEQIETGEEKQQHQNLETCFSEYWENMSRKTEKTFQEVHRRGKWPGWRTKFVWSRSI